ncbi:hypothetical protein F511_07512 [Dorcoceras hygrometricum]|uniref:Uncharacterized protein n=1 Tax=Dorcoceras hygrometricum TaxID=472368 RepID=A0A2Z7CW41_9LAMI|nr:hypothetical protein F511_07512 [Dorcoceras hygrometricum]
MRKLLALCEPAMVQGLVWTGFGLSRPKDSAMSFWVLANVEIFSVRLLCRDTLTTVHRTLSSPSADGRRLKLEQECSVGFLLPRRLFLNLFRELWIARKGTRSSNSASLFTDWEIWERYVSRVSVRVTRFQRSAFSSCGFQISPAFGISISNFTVACSIVLALALFPAFSAFNFQIPPLFWLLSNVGMRLMASSPAISRRFRPLFFTFEVALDSSREALSFHTTCGGCRWLEQKHEVAVFSDVTSLFRIRGTDLELEIQLGIWREINVIQLVVVLTQLEVPQEVFRVSQ